MPHMGALYFVDQGIEREVKRAVGFSVSFLESAVRALSTQRVQRYGDPDDKGNETEDLLYEHVFKMGDVPLHKAAREVVLYDKEECAKLIIEILMLDRFSFREHLPNLLLQDDSELGRAVLHIAALTFAANSVAMQREKYCIRIPLPGCPNWVASLGDFGVIKASGCEGTFISIDNSNVKLLSAFVQAVNEDEFEDDPDSELGRPVLHIAVRTFEATKQVQNYWLQACVSEEFDDFWNEMAFGSPLLGFLPAILQVATAFAALMLLLPYDSTEDIKVPRIIFNTCSPSVFHGWVISTMFAFCGSLIGLKLMHKKPKQAKFGGYVAVLAVLSAFGFLALSIILWVLKSMQLKRNAFAA